MNALTGNKYPSPLSPKIRPVTPMEGYAIRALARRAGLTLAHAALVAELSGIVRGERANG